MAAHTLLKCTLGAVAGLAMAAGASADYIAFTYTDPNGLSASGSMQFSDLGGGIYLATSGTMDVLACPAAPDMVGSYALVANPNAPGVTTSPMGAFNYDDLVYLPPIASGYLDVYGLLFSRAGEEINIWGNSGPNAYSGWRFNGGYSYANDQGDLQIAIVPLPPAALAGVAGLGLVGFSRLRRRAR